jgi:heme/copper-type cytochrome/quinol oxidase subunit 4
MNTIVWILYIVLTIIPLIIIMSRDINNNECKIIHYLHNHFWLFCVYNVILGTMFLFLIQVSVQSSINKYGTTEKLQFVHHQKIISLKKE